MSKETVKKVSEVYSIAKYYAQKLLTKNEIKRSTRDGSENGKFLYETVLKKSLLCKTKKTDSDFKHRLRY